MEHDNRHVVAGMADVCEVADIPANVSGLRGVAGRKRAGMWSERSDGGGQSSGCSPGRGIFAFFGGCPDADPDAVAEERGDQPLADEAGEMGFQGRDTDVVRTANKYNHKGILLVRRAAVGVLYTAILLG